MKDSQTLWMLSLLAITLAASLACSDGVVRDANEPGAGADMSAQDMATQRSPDLPPGVDPQDMSTSTPDMLAPPREDMRPELDMAPAVMQNACTSGPLSAPLQGCAPAPPASTGDPYEDCVRRINQLRWECQCLPPLERWRDGEDCADKHAAYDASRNSPHAAFRDKICPNGGSAQNECPGWGSWESANGGCLQMMWDEGPGEPFSAHGHYINMSSPRYSRVACGGSDGWFLMNFQ